MLHPHKHKLYGLPQCLRWSMFTLNVLLFISAALTLGYASYLLSSEWNLLALGNRIPIIMFISFAILLILSCLGSLAAYRLSRLLLLIYSFILWVCLILQIVIILSITTTTDIFHDDWLQDRWSDLSVADQQWIETELQCCGFNKSVPDHDNTCTKYTDFCESKLESYMSNVHLIGCIFGALVVIFEIGGIIVSCILVRSLKNEINISRNINDSNIDYSYEAEPKVDYWRL